MKQNLVVAGVAAVIGGAVGAGITLAAIGTRQPPIVAAENGSSEARHDREPSEEPTTTDPGDEAAAKRLASLERKVRLLTAAVQQRGEEHPDGGSLGGEVDVADPVFEVAVMDIIDRVETAKDKERDARHDEMRQLYAQRASQELERKLSLTPDQKQQLTAVIQQHFEATRALRTAEDRPVTRSEWRERMDAITAASERKLEDFLSPQQLEQYRELDAEDRIGSGWRGRSRRQ